MSSLFQKGTSSSSSSSSSSSEHTDLRFELLPKIFNKDTRKGANMDFCKGTGNSCSEPKAHHFWASTPPETDMTMEKQPFEDVSPIEDGVFSVLMLVFGGVFW